MPSCSLLSLPSDVTIQVFYHSTTYSRISLRQTCTTLYSISKERILWIQCLNRLIEIAHLYPPSFPMDEMSDEQLEAAANAPLRFRCNLANGQTASAPVSTRWLEIDPERAGQVLRNFVLVPGGRYLVTLTGDIVRFWDIGIVAREYVPDRLIAEVDCGIGFDRRSWINAEFNGDELYIQVEGSSVSDHYSVCSAMFRINPLEEFPQLALIGFLDTKLFISSSFHFDPYEMAVVYSTTIENGGNMWIWDLSTNILATWSSGGQTVKSIYNTEGRALVIGLPKPGQLMLQGDIYELPKFTQQSSPQQPQQLPSPFIHSVNWEEDFSGCSAENSSLASPSWWEARKTHFPFDLIGWGQADHSDAVSCEIVHKVLERCPSDSSRLDAVTRHHGVYKGQMVIPQNVSFMATYLPDDVRIMYWLRKASDPHICFLTTVSLFVHVTSITQKGEHELSSIDMCKSLWAKQGRVSWGSFGFSAATGRLCVVDGKRGVKILDYGTVIPGATDVAIDSAVEDR
ncbi:hypothetical protein DL96DRAFT_1631406 [Flagelloscypha sp. PMI_526]|nr:hypothetical protein DL96DRAFT_1631406 [Flagelloscypha sp. PMI_526]